tara:strand:- start:263 stop:901 length:639 start_codon:yes stop_codon:yes gene_type:complete
MFFSYTRVTPKNIFEHTNGVYIGHTTDVPEFICQESILRSPFKILEGALWPRYGRYFNSIYKNLDANQAFLLYILQNPHKLEEVLDFLQILTQKNIFKLTASTFGYECHVIALNVIFSEQSRLSNSKYPVRHYMYLEKLCEKLKFPRIRVLGSDEGLENKEGPSRENYVWEEDVGDSREVYASMVGSWYGNWTIPNKKRENRWKNYWKKQSN